MGAGAGTGAGTGADTGVGAGVGAGAGAGEGAGGEETAQNWVTSGILDLKNSAKLGQFWDFGLKKQRKIGSRLRSRNPEMAQNIFFFAVYRSSSRFCA